jgi:hypothetical protein
MKWRGRRQPTVDERDLEPGIRIVTVGNHYNYGEQLLKDLAAHDTIAVRHDPIHFKTEHRIKAIILYHHRTHNMETYSSSKDVKLVETWDSEAWCRAWPDGIPPLRNSSLNILATEKEQEAIFHEYVCLKPQLQDLKSAILWWGQNTAMKDIGKK